MGESDTDVEFYDDDDDEEVKRKLQKIEPPPNKPPPTKKQKIERPKRVNNKKVKKVKEVKKVKNRTDPLKLAGTLLGIYVKSLCGGPKFAAKMLPVSGLTSAFLDKNLTSVSKDLKDSGVQVLAIISDGHKTNQAFFKENQESAEKPYYSKDRQYLLFDFIHLLKNVRNSWITEVLKHLKFPIFDEDGKISEWKIAKWDCLVKLNAKERGGQNFILFALRASTLTDVAIAPAYIERQNTDHLFAVFSRKTVAALRRHAALNTETEEREEFIACAEFIEIVVEFYEIVNNNMVGGLEIRSVEDKKLKKILRFGKMAMAMQGQLGVKREKCLCYDTAKCIDHTCRGLDAVAKYLLTVKHFEYVLLRQFSGDPIENYFSRLRTGQGSGYYLSCQNAEQTNAIFKTTSILKSGTELEDLGTETKHSCSKCYFVITESSEMCDKFDNLDYHMDHLQDEFEKAKTKRPGFCELMVNVSGYVMRKSTDEILEDGNWAMGTSENFYQQFKTYFDEIDFGNLQKPSDNVFQFCCSVIIFFEQLGVDLIENICQTSALRIINEIRLKFKFQINTAQMKAICNIMIKAYVRNVTKNRNYSENQKKLAKFQSFKNNSKKVSKIKKSAKSTGKGKTKNGKKCEKQSKGTKKNDKKCENNNSKGAKKGAEKDSGKGRNGTKRKLPV